MRAAPRRLIALLLALAATGCIAPRYHDRAENPIEGVRRIAIAPLAARLTLTNLEELDELMSRELARFPGVDRVIQPSEVAVVLRDRELDLNREADLRHLATLLQVDAILVVELTEYEFVQRPTIAYVARLFIGDSPLETGTAALDMARAGRPRDIREPGPGNFIEIEKVYDASENETRDRIWWYSLARDGEDTAVDGVDRILRVPDEYFQFASFSLINALFGEYSRRLEEVRSQKT